MKKFNEFMIIKFPYVLMSVEKLPEALRESFQAGYNLAQKENAEKTEKLKKSLMHYADYTNNQDSPYNYELARQILKDIE